MKIGIIYLIVIISLFICCEPVPIPDPCPPDCPEDSTIYPLDIVWETYFYPDSSSVHFSSAPITYKDNILYCGWDPSKENKFHVYMFNKGSGDQIHRFDMGANSVDRISIIEDHLIATSLSGIYVFDLITFELLSRIDKNYENNHSVFGNYVYAIQDFTSVPFLDSASVVKLKIPTLTIEKVMTITKEEYGGYSKLNPVSVDLQSGDTVLY